MASAIAERSRRARRSLPSRRELGPGYAIEGRWPMFKLSLIIQGDFVSLRTTILASIQEMH
jgi:hypothetical protein